MLNLPKVELLKLIDTKDVDWCEEAVLLLAMAGEPYVLILIKSESIYAKFCDRYFFCLVILTN